MAYHMHTCSPGCSEAGLSKSTLTAVRISLTPMMDVEVTLNLLVVAWNLVKIMI